MKSSAVKKYVLCALVVILNSQFSVLQAQAQTKQNVSYKAALALERQGQFQKAVESYAKLFKSYPENSSYYHGLKRNLERIGKYDAMIEVIQKRLLIVNDILGKADLGYAYYKNNDKERASEIWNNLLEKNKTNAVSFIHVASAMLRNGLHDEAIRVYKNGRRILKKPYIFSLELANIYSSKLEYALAIREFLSYVNLNPRQVSYIERRILTQFQLDSQEAILQEVKKAVVASEYKSRTLLRIYASCLKKVDRFADALEMLLEMTEIAPPSDKKNSNEIMLYNYANELIQLKQIDLAVAAFDSLTRRWPGSSFYFPARLNRAKALQAGAKYTEALQAFDEIIGQTKNERFLQQALLDKGQLLIKVNRPENALKVFLAIQNKFQQKPVQKQAALFLGDTYFAMDKFTKAKASYNRALRLGDTQDPVYNNQINYKLGELLFAQHKFNQAIAYFEKIQMVKKGLASSHLYNDALEFILLIEENEADSSGALVHFADFYRLQKQGRQAAGFEMLENLVSKYPGSALRPHSMMEMAAIHVAEKNHADALKLYSRVEKDHPDSFYSDYALLQRARLLEQTGAFEKALAHYEKVLTKYPQSIHLEEARARIRALRKTSSREM